LTLRALGRYSRSPIIEIAQSILARLFLLRGDLVSRPALIDIHCHLVAGIDDGAQDASQSLAMARMAVADGIRTIICTPHQAGNYAANKGDDIRAAVARTQQMLTQRKIPLKLLPGGDVRIEADMAAGLRRGDLLTLGDHGRHVLLELPHELYFPLEPVLKQLARLEMVGILSHPERNQGILRQPEVLAPLVEAGCLMQVTAGSLTANFGDDIYDFSAWMLEEGMVHFVATDAHGVGSRRPVLSEAYRQVSELVSEEVAELLCCRNPGSVAAGRDVDPGFVRVRQGVLAGWFGWRRAS
jgi:protein-tyrosine phosphatase